MGGRAGGATYKALHSIGRCAIYGKEIDGDASWYAVLHGTTCGSAVLEAAQKTDIAIASLVEELRAVRKDQVCIIGDLNAEVEDIPMALDLVENEGWVDAAMREQQWGGKKV